MRGFILFLFCTLMVIGLCQVVKNFSMWLLSTKKLKVTYLIIFLKGHKEDIEYILKGQINRMYWQEDVLFEKILCVNTGIDVETENIINKMINDYPKLIKMCSKDEFYKILQKKDENNLQTIVL